MPKMKKKVSNIDEIVVNAIENSGFQTNMSSSEANNLEENKKESQKMISKTIQLTLSSEDWKRIDKYCDSKGFKRGSFIRTLVRDFINNLQ